MSYNHKYILNTRIDNAQKDVILSKMITFLDDGRFRQITTLNPEILLKAYKNKDFKNILNEADLNVADGIGIKFAFWRYGEHLKSRYSGIDLMWDILEIANKKNLSIYLAAKKDGLSTWQETKTSIQKKYPDLKISGINITNVENTLPVINNSILFVNLGAPHQEILLNKLKNSKNTSMRLSMGVGGSFDYITGKVPRAPKFMRYMGIEWLYRLFKQPNRFRRIINAVIVFPVTVLFARKDGQKLK